MQDVYRHEYLQVLNNIARNRVPAESILPSLSDRELYFPSTELSAASINADPIQRHNFRAFAFSMLESLGFLPVRAVDGHYILKDGNVPPFLLAKSTDESRNSLNLFKHVLLSMALLGFGQHSKELYNTVQMLFYQKKISLGLTNFIKPEFETWCSHQLFPAIVANPVVHFEGEKDWKPENPVKPFEFVQSGGIHLLMRMCDHGLVAAATRGTAGEIRLACAMHNSNDTCRFSEAPQEIS